MRFMNLLRNCRTRGSESENISNPSKKKKKRNARGFERKFETIHHGL